MNIVDIPKRRLQSPLGTLCLLLSLGSVACGPAGDMHDMPVAGSGAVAFVYPQTRTQTQAPGGDPVQPPYQGLVCDLGPRDCGPLAGICYDKCPDAPECAHCATSTEVALCFDKCQQASPQARCENECGQERDYCAMDPCAECVNAVDCPSDPFLSAACVGGVCALLDLCGNGTRESPEQCDSADLGGETCQTATLNMRPNGAVSCNPDCMLNITGCY